MSPSRQHVFVCAAGAMPAGAASNELALLQLPIAITFKTSSRAAQPPFAWMGGFRHGSVRVPPLARCADIECWEMRQEQQQLLQEHYCLLHHCNPLHSQLDVIPTSNPIGLYN
jgi:hypothetical protein